MDNSPGRRLRSALGRSGFIAASRAYIVPWGFEDYARLPRAPFKDDPHLYPPSPRRDTYGSMASAAIGNPLPAQVAGFFDRSDYTPPGRRPRPIHGNVTFPASRCVPSLV